MRIIATLLQNRTGATAIEYGLIAALISLSAIVALQGIGTQLKGTFQKTSSSMK